MPRYWTLDTDHKIHHFMEEVRTRRMKGDPLVVQFVNPPRNPDQNAMLHGLIQEIEPQWEGHDFRYIKNYIKLVLGVPILRASDNKFREGYDKSVKHLEFEQKIDAMDLLPVTSVMDKDQFSKLLDSVLSHFQDKGFEFKPA